VSQQLKTEAGGKAVLIFLKDGEEDELHDIEKQLFEMNLPLKEKSQMKAVSDYSDDAVDREVSHEIKLYRCSDDDGTLRVTEVKVGPLYQSDLNSGVHKILSSYRQVIYLTFLE
jgi:hypothetical protein